MLNDTASLNESYDLALAQLRMALDRLAELIPCTQREELARDSQYLSYEYPRLLLAIGFARLGHPNEARRCFTATDKTDDVVHSVLRCLFAVRLTEALNGKPYDTPLSEEVKLSLNSL